MFGPRRKRRQPLSGDWGEEIAARFLRKQGARLVARNFRTRRGEIDLILRHEGAWVFAEVKLRRAGAEAFAAAAVNPPKQRKIVRTALTFLRAKGLNPHTTLSRFDVLVVTPDRRVEWLRAAFEVS